MKKQVPGILFMVLFSFLFSIMSVHSRAEETRMTNPNALNLELFGRGMRVSAGYDRVLNEDLAGGFSFGSTPLNRLDDSDANQNAHFFSGFVNYYLTRDQGSVYVSGGASLVTNLSQSKGYKTALGGLKLSSSGVVPTAGIGYENRGETGFLFRMAAYVMADNNVVPWLGITFGYAF